MQPIQDRSTIGQKTTKGQQIFSAFLLAGILSFGSSVTISNNAVAYPESAVSSSKGISEIAQTPSDNRANRLPPQVVRAVRQDLSRRTGVAPGRLRITEYSRQTWPDGCLGLAQPDQICTQALVEGWRVVVSDGNKTWVYRSNTNGTTLRLEGQPVSLNLPKQVVNQRTATTILKPVPIPASELPPALDRDVVFRAVSSGGITGRTYETTLLRDGNLMRVRIGDANDSERSVRQISRQQVRQFQQLLQRPAMARFNRLSYPAPNGSADYITVTITSAAGTTRYADMVENSLPQPLRQVVQAWNQISRG